jgi:hypothetical protein
MSAVRGESARYGRKVTGFINTDRMPEAQVSFMNTLFNALYEYTPQEYSGPVLVYAAKTQPLHHLFQVEAVWAKIAARIEVVPISGTHVSILEEPHVIALADHLGKRLAELRHGAVPIPEISGPKRSDHESLDGTATVPELGCSMDERAIRHRAAEFKLGPEESFVIETELAT